MIDTQAIKIKSSKPPEPDQSPSAVSHVTVQAKTVTIWGHPNDFAIWLEHGGLEPDESSTMNCWDAVLFAAYRAKEISKEQIQQIYKNMGAMAALAYRADPTANEVVDSYGNKKVPAVLAWHKALMNGMISGQLQTYEIDPVRKIGKRDIAAGDLIFFNGVAHVAVSLGTRDAQGRHGVMIHWIYPHILPNKAASVGFMQVTSVEELMAHESLNDSVIEFGTPAWAAPARRYDGSSGSDRNVGDLPVPGDVHKAAEALRFSHRDRFGQ